ncbi:hypothetical protein ACE1OE_08585 [Vibrio sp. E150_011]
MNLKTALSAVFFITLAPAVAQPVLNPFSCESVNDYIQLSIEREKDSGFLTITTQSNATLKVDINNGVARYGLNKAQFPLGLYDEKTQRHWVINADCQVQPLER